MTRMRSSGLLNRDRTLEEKTFGQVRTITGSDSNTNMSQPGSRLTSAVECNNNLAEHPKWATSSDPRRLRLPVWQDGGDVSAKIATIGPTSWESDVYVKMRGAAQRK